MFSDKRVNVIIRTNPGDAARQQRLRIESLPLIRRGAYRYILYACSCVCAAVVIVSVMMKAMYGSANERIHGDMNTVFVISLVLTAALALSPAAASLIIKSRENYAASAAYDSFFCSECKIIGFGSDDILIGNHEENYTISYKKIKYCIEDSDGLYISCNKKQGVYLSSRFFTPQSALLTVRCMRAIVGSRYEFRGLMKL